MQWPPGRAWNRLGARPGAPKVETGPRYRRIGELVAEFTVQTNLDELKARADVRNPVTHGRPRAAAAQEKAAVTQL